MANIDSEYTLDRNDFLKRAELEGTVEPANEGGVGGGTWMRVGSLQDPPFLTRDFSLDIDAAGVLDNFDFDSFLKRPYVSGEAFDLQVDLTFGGKGQGDESGQLFEFSQARVSPLKQLNGNAQQGRLGDQSPALTELSDEDFVEIVAQESTQWRAHLSRWAFGSDHGDGESEIVAAVDGLRTVDDPSDSVIENMVIAEIVQHLSVR